MRLDLPHELHSDTSVTSASGPPLKAKLIRKDPKTLCNNKDCWLPFHLLGPIHLALANELEKSQKLLSLKHISVFHEKALYLSLVPIGYDLFPDIY